MCPLKWLFSWVYAIGYLSCRYTDNINERYDDCVEEKGNSPSETKVCLGGFSMSVSDANWISDVWLPDSEGKTSELTLIALVRPVSVDCEINAMRSRLASSKRPLSLQRKNVVKRARVRLEVALQRQQRVWIDWQKLGPHLDKSSR